MSERLTREQVEGWRGAFIRSLPMPSSLEERLCDEVLALMDDVDRLRKVLAEGGNVMTPPERALWIHRVRAALAVPEGETK